MASAAHALPDAQSAPSSDSDSSALLDAASLNPMERRAAMQQLLKQLEIGNMQLGRHLLKLRQQLDSANSSWADTQQWGVPQVSS